MSVGGEICERGTGVVVTPVLVLLRRALDPIRGGGDRPVDLVRGLGHVQRRMAGDVDGDPDLLIDAALVLASGVDQVHLDLDGRFASQHPFQRAAEVDLAVLAERVGHLDVNASYQQLHREASLGLSACYGAWAMEGNPESERFVQVAQAEDPFTADALEAALKKAGMAVLRTDHPGGSGVDALGTGWALPWFELSVLEENVTRARAVVEDERRRLAEDAPEAERAAEDEERESEGSGRG